MMINQSIDLCVCTCTFNEKKRGNLKLEIARKKIERMTRRIKKHRAQIDEQIQ